MRRTIGQLAGIQVDPSRPAVVVDGVTETFRLFHERPGGLKERLYRFRRASYTDFNAVEDVTFQIEHGESVAVIGHNGSGKSTLLKLLARILPPDEGSVYTNGRVASLLELGAGFHGDLTGRENIYLNGAILGLNRAEIDERFDEIVDFAGIRPLLDTAVRTYSSGLYVRLGFAIAVTVDPDILLVDEVLAVGDAEFQDRSLQRMQTYRDEGKTFVLVSHDLDAVREMCDRTLVMEHGRIVFDGPVAEGVELYRQRVASAAAPPGPRRRDARRVRVEEVALLGPDGQAADEIAPSTPLTARVRLRAIADVDVCSVGLIVTRGDGTHLYELHTTWQGVGVGPLAVDQEAVVDMRFVAHLLAGHYAITVSVTDVSGRETWAVVPDATRFSVAPAPGGAGLVDLAASTAVSEGPARRLNDASQTAPIPIARLQRRRRLQ
ncbi:MAG TPA: ABC transporter ATP-binding protein [Egicoccus sp.]|nr:ABC transporter ATP-binding protein [Egicoccus sp.]HSK24246.1 ABC transporter ATP-binding protein [Egicoccus sp.]